MTFSCAWSSASFLGPSPWIPVPLHSSYPRTPSRQNHQSHILQRFYYWYYEECKIHDRDLHHTARLPCLSQLFILTSRICHAARRGRHSKKTQLAFHTHGHHTPNNIKSSRLSILKFWPALLLILSIVHKPVKIMKLQNALGEHLPQTDNTKDPYPACAQSGCAQYVKCIRYCSQKGNLWILGAAKGLDIPLSSWKCLASSSGVCPALHAPFCTWYSPSCPTVFYVLSCRVSHFHALVPVVIVHNIHRRFKYCLYMNPLFSYCNPNHVGHCLAQWQIFCVYRGECFEYLACQWRIAAFTAAVSCPVWIVISRPQSW